MIGIEDLVRGRQLGTVLIGDVKALAQQKGESSLLL